MKNHKLRVACGSSNLLYSLSDTLHVHFKYEADYNVAYVTKALAGLDWT